MESIDRGKTEVEFEDDYSENRISRVIEKRQDGTTWESCGYILGLAKSDSFEARLDESNKIADFASKAAILGFRSSIGTVTVVSDENPRAYFFLERILK